MEESIQRLELVGVGTTFRDALCETLSENKLFADLQWAELKTIAGYMQGYRAVAGVTIFEEGEAGSYLCLVLEGRVAVLKENLAGERRVVAALGPGKTFGEMAVVDGERRSATALAETESQLAILTRGNFDKLIAEYPALAIHLVLRLARVMSQRLRVVSGQLVDFLDH